MKIYILSLFLYISCSCLFIPFSDAKWLPGISKSTTSSPGSLSQDNKTALLTLEKQSSDTKTIQTMSFDELKTQKNKRLAENNKEMAIKYLTKMIPLCDDLNEQSILTLELADLLFDCEKLHDAETHYREFCTLFPGDSKIEYALYKAILCSFKTILEPDRDQTKTHQTIELVNSFLQRQDVFTIYIDQVKTMRVACYKRLADSELNIIYDYMNRKRFNEAERRIEFVRTNLLPDISDLGEALLTLQDTLVAQQSIDKAAPELVKPHSQPDSRPEITNHKSSSIA